MSFSWLNALPCTLACSRVLGVDSTRTRRSYCFMYMPLPNVRVFPLLRSPLAWWWQRGASLGWLLNPTGTSVFRQVEGMLIPRGLGRGRLPDRNTIRVDVTVESERVAFGVGGGLGLSGQRRYMLVTSTFFSLSSTEQCRRTQGFGGVPEQGIWY